MKKLIHKQSSHLLDELIGNTKNTTTRIEQAWYIARPLNYTKSILVRLIGAVRVLRGKSIAVHFKSDEN